MGNLSKMLLGTTLLTACLVACQEKTQINLTQSGLNPANFEAEFNGKKTQLFTMTNANGMEVSITNFGGRVVSIMVPDKEGKLRDVVLGFDSITQYVDSINTPSDFGAAIGRYANRIDQGKIAINGDSIQLPMNNFGHCLHGGPQGWQYQVYEGAQLNDSTITMELLSADGDAGFPGNMAVMVSYVLTSDNALEISYEATTDKTTIINMTNYSYFNLNGDPSQPITDHILYLNADNFTPVDATYMTTGEISPVENTPMDFRKEHKIGTDINKFSEIGRAHV